MRRLLGVELSRLWWRRAVRVLLLLSLVVPLVILVGTAWATRPISAAELAAAEQTAAQEAERSYVRDSIEECIESPEDWLGPEAPGTPAEVEALCVESQTPQAEWFLGRTPLDVAAVVNDLAPVVATVVAMLLLLAGATYAGADWSSGSMSNQLLFSPRRVQVWGAKALALSVTAAVVGVVVQTAFWSALTLLSRARDLPVAASVWDRLLPGILGRATLLVVGAALLGYALTMLFRSTVGTLGVVLAVAVAGTFVVAALPLGGDNERWMLHTNVAAAVLDGVDYYRQDQGFSTCVEVDGVMQCSGMARLGLGPALGYLATVLLVPLVAGLLAFTRRDVP